MGDPRLVALRDDSGLPGDVRGTVATVGTFDGVHLGHRDVLARLTARARAAGLRSLLVTFEPHPLEVVNPAAAPPLLTPGREKVEALADCGVDYVGVLPFTRALAGYEAEQFVEFVLRRRFRMRELLIGHDHGFGRGRGSRVMAAPLTAAWTGVPARPSDDPVAAIRPPYERSTEHASRTWRPQAAA